MAEKKKTETNAAIPLPPGADEMQQTADHTDYEPEGWPTLKVGGWVKGILAEPFEGKHGKSRVIHDAAYAVEHANKPDNTGCAFYVPNLRALDSVLDAPTGTKAMIQFLGEKELDGGKTFKRFRCWLLK